MRHTEIKERVGQHPFIPFRLRMSDGQAYDVTHPEAILITRTAIAVGLYKKGSSMAERIVFCDPVHIIRIQPITNGRKNGKGREKRRE